MATDLGNRLATRETRRNVPTSTGRTWVLVIHSSASPAPS